MRQIFTFLILFLPFIVLAQSNYKPGYVIANSGDTVRGYINTKEWDNSPRTIDFKVDLSNRKPTVYSPATIQSFEVYNISKYISYTGKISMDAIDFNNSSPGIDTTSKQDTIFLKQLYTGSKISLFSNNDKVKQQLFFKEANQKAVELTFHQYYTDQNTIISTVEYKRQLQYLSNKYNGSEKTNRIINSMNFSISEIERVLQLINEDVILKQKSSANRIFLGGGIAYQATKFDGDNNFAKAGKSNYAAPFLSIGYDIFQNKQTQKLVFRGELQVSYNAPKFSYPVSDFILNNADANYSFNQLTFGITPQVIYNIYNSDAVKFYLDAGVAFNLSRYSNNKYGLSNTSSYDRDNYYKLESFWATLPVKVGLLLNRKIELFAVYTYPGVYSNYTEFSISTQTIAFGVHYCFDKGNRR